MLAGSIANTKLATQTNSNTANTIVTRDATGNFCANIITANLNGNANTATGLSTVLSGDISSGGANNLVTTIGTGKVLNCMLAGGITNDKFTCVFSTNTANSIICRDANGCFKISAITFQPNATTPSPQIGALKVYCCLDASLNVCISRLYLYISTTSATPWCLIGPCYGDPCVCLANS